MLITSYLIRKPTTDEPWGCRPATGGDAMSDRLPKRDAKALIEALRIRAVALLLILLDCDASLRVLAGR